MVNPDDTQRGAGPSPQDPPDTQPASGYTRLSLVRFRAWQILLVLLVLGGISFLLFPRERMLIDFHLERGRTDKALDEIDRMLEKEPADPELLKLAAETHFLTGDMAEAVRLQERAVSSVPQEPDALKRLATFYEWNRNPREALKTYERIAARDPVDAEALRKVIEYSRYFGRTDLEARSVARLLEQEDAEAKDDPLLRELTRTLGALAAEWRTRGPDPLLDELLVRLYLVRSDTLDDRQEGGVPTTTAKETAETALYFFLVTGRLEDGRDFARRLDEALEAGLTHRLTWVNFLRWNGLPERALELLVELQEQEPEDPTLARLAAEVAGQTGNVTRLIRAVEQRLRLEPESRRLKESLANLYRASGDLERAFELYEDLHRARPRDPEVLESLLATADRSDAPALKVRAANLAGRLEPQETDLLERRATLYLEAGDPKKAWPLLSVLAARSGGDRKAVRRMIEVAGYTDDPALLKQALSQALALRPDDTALRREAMEGFLWMEGPEKAYRTQLELVKRPGARRKDVFRLIELAGFTERPELEREAVMLAALRLQGPGTKVLPGSASRVATPASDGDVLSAVRDYLERHPEDGAFRDLLIRRFLESGRPGRAAPLLADRSDRSPRDFRKALEAGEAYLQADELDRGLPYFERALAIDSANNDLRRRLVTYYGWLGLREKQVAEMIRLEEQGLLKPEERIQLAEVFLERQEGGRALELLRGVKDLNPLPKREGLLLAAAYETTGNRDQAMAVYSRLAESHRDDPALLAEMGDRALWLDRLPAALSFYEAALRLDPKNLRALKGSGQIHAWNNNPDRAVDRFEAYNRLNPDDFEVRYQLGELYFANQRKGAAFREYQKTLRLMDRMKQGGPSPQPSARSTRTRQ